MSANKSNAAISRAARVLQTRRRKRGNGGGGTSQQLSFMKIPLDPNQEFQVDLRLGEWTLYLDNTTTLQQNPIQGFSPAAPPWDYGVATSDSYPSSYYVMFQTNFTNDSSQSPLFNVFRQFQIRGMEFKFEALVSDSWNVSGVAQTTSGLPCSPELLIATENTTTSTLPAPNALLGYTDVQRTTMSPGKLASFYCIPRPQLVLEVENPGFGTASAGLPKNANSIWYYTAAKTVFTAAIWCMRSWYTETGIAGRGSPPIRVSPRIRVAFRMPHN